MAFSPSEIIGEFRERFGTQAEPALYRAPGRVNLIGEHTDYNLGYVFPIALDMACFAAIAPAMHGELRIQSQDFDGSFAIKISDIASAQPQKKWTDYPLGVAQQLAMLDVPLSGADLLVTSTVPVGSGLSSSAALEVATAIALLGDRSLPKIDIALLAQRAETGFVGMPCGVMDQYTSVFGQEGSAVQIDCRSLQHEYVTLPSNVAVIAVNSMVKHELGSSAYRDRVAECAAAVSAISKLDESVQSLRDVSLAMFERIQGSIPLVPRRRARHIISDTQRVLDLAAAARARDLAEMGRLFIASHRSMQYDYEISAEEIDFLVDTAIKIPGVYGARMTGGGFGGCTVNLVEPAALEAFRSKVSAAYQERYGITPVFYDCQPSAGASRIQ